MSIKDDQAKEVLKVFAILEEWLKDNKDRICFEELMNVIDGYKDYYGNDGEFFMGSAIDTMSNDDKLLDETDDELLGDNEQLIEEDYDLEEK